MNFRRLLFLTTVLLSGCEDPEIFTQTGVVKGTISVFDEFGTRIDPTGANVILRNEKTEAAAVTDANGNFEIIDVSLGTYDLTIERTDAVSTIVKSIRVAGGEAPLYVRTKLARGSDAKVSNFSIASTSPGTYRISCNVTSATAPASKVVGAAVFLSTRPDVSSTNYRYAFKLSAQNGSIGPLSAFTLDSNMFPSGTKVYAIAYGCGYETSTSNLFLFNEDFTIVEYLGLANSPTEVKSIDVP